jgi:uncharacterized membrane protein
VYGTTGSPLARRRLAPHMFRLKVLGIILVLLVVLNVVTAVAGIHLDDSTRTGIIWGVIIIGFIGWLIYTPIEMRRSRRKWGAAIDSQARA